jgi:hypothetical protein
VAAELNARRHFYVTALSSVFNYPLFALMWFASSVELGGSFPQAIACFMVSSFARWAWLSGAKSLVVHAVPSAHISEQGLTALQSVLNLGMFRLDQVALSLAFFAGAASAYSEGGVAQYMYLARGSEVLIGFSVVAGTVLFPRRYVSFPSVSSANRVTYRFVSAAGLGLLAISIVVTLILRHLYRGPILPTALIVPFVLQVPLALVSNLMTYSFMRDERVPALLRNLLITLVVGSAWVLLSRVRGIEMLAWTVPIQLSVFVTLCVTFGWGEKRVIYARHR